MNIVSSFTHTHIESWKFSTSLFEQIKIHRLGNFKQKVVFNYDERIQGQDFTERNRSKPEEMFDWI